MTRVLFVNAADPDVEVENRYKPLWPAYLAATAERRLGSGRVEFRLAEGPLARAMDAWAPDIVAISAVSQNFNWAIESARVAKRRGASVLVGGIHISELPESLTDDMDAGCAGEGEDTFCELLEAFLEDGSFRKDRLKQIRGVLFRDGGRLNVTATRPRVERLDDLPHPKRSLIGYPSHAYMFTSRGCPYRCVFCASTRFWENVRFASAEHVVEEIEELVGHGTRMISFYDDLFVANRKRLSAIADMVVARGLAAKVRFTCSCRANTVNEAVVADLKRMNAVSVALGLESGNDRILAYLKGGISVADNMQAVERLKDAGIQANASFVIGSPDETEEEIADTYAFIARSRLDFVDTYVLTPLPGTPVWDHALGRGLVSNSMDWSRLDVNFATAEDRAIIVSEKITRERLKILYARFRRQRFWRILRALPGSPWLSDLPKVLAGIVRGWVRRLSRRVAGRGPSAPADRT